MDQAPAAGQAICDMLILNVPTGSGIWFNLVTTINRGVPPGYSGMDYMERELHMQTTLKVIVQKHQNQDRQSQRNDGQKQNTELHWKNYHQGNKQKNGNTCFSSQCNP